MRRYRWLLATYPRAYRRRRGEEILGTLLDELPPGRERPTIRQAAGLVLAGLVADHRRAEPAIRRRGLQSRLRRRARRPPGCRTVRAPRRRRGA
jgi:hypothetical protein